MSAIPKSLNREHVFRALNQILRHGVPRNRKSTKHCLVHGENHFPPKLVISLSAADLVPGGLHSGDFSGGPETNDVLTALGFHIALCNCGGYQRGGVHVPIEELDDALKPVIIPVRIDALEEVHYSDRLLLMRQMIAVIQGATQAPYLLVLPGGFLDSFGDDPAELCTAATEAVPPMLVDAPVGSVICFGIDGRDGADQLGLAFHRDGLVAMARKFFPVGDEHEYLNPADSPWAQEAGKDRVFRFGPWNFYMAVCYDSFGIKKQRVPNRQVDAVLNLVHGFTKPPEAGSGSFYFARDGMVGAARTWGRPVFGAAHFYGGIHQRWPTAVAWNQGALEGKLWRYRDNPLRPAEILSYSDGFETVEMAVYPIDAFVELAEVAASSEN